MSDTRCILIAQALPPIVLGDHPTAKARRAVPFPRVGRLVWLAAAISLPALGLTFADLVHRGERTGVPQAAAPVLPSAGAAVPPRAGRSLRMVRSTAPNRPSRSIQA